jgi:hypothetical protein
MKANLVPPARVVTTAQRDHKKYAIFDQISFPGLPATAHIGASKMLVISGGDGYEHFGSSGSNDAMGREDSTNHLLLWQM